MASLNQVSIIGNLGKDPEVRFTKEGNAVANLSVATTEKWRDKAGDLQEETEWHRVVLYGKRAEVAQEYLKSGHPVFIQGRLQTREWEDKDGNARTTTEIVASDMQMLKGKTQEQGQEKSRPMQKERETEMER